MVKDNNKGQQDEVDKMNTVLFNTEHWIEKNQKAIIAIIIIAIVVVVGFLAVRQFYFIPREAKAQAEMFKGEMYLERDSFNLALNGNGADYIGFKAIADEYSFTKAGNLAKVYTGICYYNLGDNEEALKYFEEYSGDDAILAPNILAMMGNCYANLGKYDEAMDSFISAADKSENDLTTPIFIKKAAVVAEKKGDYAKAVELYQQIKDKYENSYIGRDIDKYIERAKLNVGNK
ncbi:MAG: tetratricopeptide repeat protein [Bacteroidales bacterium]